MKLRCSCASRLRERCREWNRYSYLSRFERRLNRSLWALLVVGVVYSVLQHVVLANVPEVFRSGARWGDLLYDVAIAYVGAFVFYLLIIRLPLRRDRRNVYQNLAPLVSRIAGEATALMTDLNNAAGVPDSRRNTLDNVGETCSLIRPTPVPSFGVPTPSGIRVGTVMEVIRYHVGRAREVHRELLEFAPYLASDLIDHIVGIEQRGYFGAFDAADRTVSDVSSMPNMSWLTRSLFDYLQLVDRADQYYREFFHAFQFSGSFLVAGTRRPCDAIPLEHYMSE